jgi:hypothetical protein
LLLIEVEIQFIITIAAVPNAGIKTERAMCRFGIQGIDWSRNTSTVVTYSNAKRRRKLVLA